MNNTCRTPKGTELPLLNLKGKPYLQVGHRLIWLNEDAARFNVTTDLIKLTDNDAVTKALVQVYNAEGQLLRSATATKREDSKGFPDFIEKSETGAIGRALAILGYGTQFTLPDLDEGDRLADSPLIPAKKAVTPIMAAPLAIIVPATPIPVAASQAAIELAKLASEPAVPTTSATRPTFRRGTPPAATVVVPKVPSNDF